ncbi:hypothetical protein PENTCL1PPCAC_19190 [Pristionchus entomophagus]|uniref:Uncharacterized protein n=1 Tax=Pristionchus entomophagus TaxID=358040 RepID=A0AAV5TRB5_9BILA|nr:hypothetical protein PENTCL1PPCAC_19190 [Pristionchus entomophagus]
MGNKQSSVPSYGHGPGPGGPYGPPPGGPHPGFGFEHHLPPPPPGAIDEGWARRPAPITRAPGWAGSRMSLAGSRVDLAYSVDPHHEQMIVLQPDPKMLKKIHKEQKKLLKKMRGLPVEVIVAPVGTAGRLPPPPLGHPGSAHPPPPRTYSIDNLHRDYGIYTRRDDLLQQRRPMSTNTRGWGSTGPNGSIDSPMTSSAGSNTMDNPSWISDLPLHRPPSGPATNLARSETDRLDWQRRHRVVTTTHIERCSSPPPPRPRRVDTTPRPRSLWMDDPRRAQSTTAMHSTGREKIVTERRVDRSNWSSSAASSDRLGGSTGDIDFSWVREEEGRLRNGTSVRGTGGEAGKGMPECYFGREEEATPEPTKGETRKSREINDNTMSMAF